MSEPALFIMFILIAIIPFVLGGMMECNRRKEQETKPCTDYRITIEPVVVIPKTISNTTKDITKEAKDILVTCGFTASEAKQLISEAGSHNTVSDLVEAALMRAKI